MPLLLVLGALFQSKPLAASPTVSRSHLGIAYQTWNKPLGVWQTPEQLEADLAAMEAIGIRSARVEFVWGNIETKPDHLDFSLPDLLVATARRHGIRIYPIIGFQWPPDWLGESHHLEFKDGKPSPLLDYADGYVRARFGKFIGAVVRHYRGDDTIEAWVLGNEFSYLEYNSFQQLGLGAHSRPAFVAFLRSKYGGSVARLNRAWDTSFRSFNEITPASYPLDSDSDVVRRPTHDFLDYRREQIAGLVATGCRAAHDADPEAPLTYSSIGVLFSQFDRFSTSEDFAAIAGACRAAGAPLSFYSLNSYLNLNSREPFYLGLSSKIAGALTGLETVFTEFGLTSTEQYLDVREEKQARYLKAQYLESVFDGVPQVHVFTWNDKSFVSPREQGFGILTEGRREKPAFIQLRELLSRLGTLDARALARDFVPDEAWIGFLLPDPEQGQARWNTYLNEIWTLASYIRRLDLPVSFVRPEDLDRPDKIRGMKALFLVRQGLLGMRHLGRIDRLVRAGKFHAIAISDVPGYDLRDSTWERRIHSLFGARLAELHRSDNLSGVANLELALPEPGGATRVTSFGIWQWSQIIPDEGTEASPAQTWLVPSHRARQPLYFIKRQSESGSAGVLFTVSLGYLFGDPKKADSPNVVVLEMLRELLGKSLKIPLPDRVQSAAVPWSLPVLQTRTLRDGGHLVFVAAIPPLVRDASFACPKAVQIFEIRGLEPNEKLVSLAGTRNTTADGSGKATLTLDYCDSDLLITERNAAKYLDASKPRPNAAAAEPAMQRLHAAFPARVALVGRPSCLAQSFQAAGYEHTQLGIVQAPRLADWKVEAPRGLYMGEDAKAANWARYVGVLAISGSDSLDTGIVQDFLRQDPARRALIRADGLMAFARARLFPYRHQILFVTKDCLELTPAALTAFLDQ